jgi:hypothetical protein
LPPILPTANTIEETTFYLEDTTTHLPVSPEIFSPKTYEIFSTQTFIPVEIISTQTSIPVEISSSKSIEITTEGDFIEMPTESFIHNDKTEEYFDEQLENEDIFHQMDELDLEEEIRNGYTDESTKNIARVCTKIPE